MTEIFRIFIKASKKLLTREYSVGIEILTNINVAFHDGIEGCLMDTTRFHTQEGWLEKGFWAPEPFIADGNDLSIRQFVRFLKGRGGSSGGHLLFEVQGNIAELFFDITDNFPLSCKGGNFLMLLKYTIIIRMNMSFVQRKLKLLC